MIAADVLAATLKWVSLAEVIQYSISPTHTHGTNDLRAQ
jgi:hypothetical protein